MLRLSDFKNKKIKKSRYFGKVKLQILISVALLTIALIFTQLVFANNLATDGEKLSQIDQEIHQLEAQNTTIRMEIAKESALSQLAEKAKDLGYSKPAKIIRP